MKVVPRIKQKSLKQNEVRVITIDETAIQELLLENLLAHKSEYFNVEEISDSNICLMDWDRHTNLLTYVILPIKYYYEGYRINFNYIRSEIGITTCSLFNSNRYKSLNLTSQMVIRSE